METSKTSGFNVFTEDQQPSGLWRPWTGEPASHMAQSIHGDVQDAKQSKAPVFIHPVKLYWPKSKCFDYLYRDAEMLLRNYPVQATISPYEDSSSDEDSEDEDEEVEKELN